MSGEIILVVEDNERNRKLMHAVLDSNGYRILEAACGEDALELAVARRPTVALIDVQLPGIDGIETLVRLRDDERTARIPVVAVTAQAMRGDRERLLAAGFDSYLAKPIDIGELLANRRRFCGS